MGSFTSSACVFALTNRQISNIRGQFTSVFLNRGSPSILYVAVSLSQTYGHLIITIGFLGWCTLTQIKKS